MKISRNIIPAVIFLALCLASCGSTPAPAASGDASPTVAASPSVVVRTNGCPIQNLPVDPLPPAQVVVTQQSGANTAPTTLNLGKSLEIHLSPSFVWHLNLADPNQILGATALEGWYNKSLAACIWRYSATKVGKANLSFTGTVLCQSNQPCPQLAIETIVDVIVN